MSNLQPFFIKWVTELVQAGNYDQALRYLAVFGGLLVGGNMLITMAYAVGDRSMAQTSADLQAAVLKHLHDLDFAYHINKSSGKLISVMRRGDEAYFGFYHFVNREIYSTVLVFALMFATYAVIQIKYLWLGLGVTAASIALSIWLVQINIRARKLFNKADDDVSALRVDNLMNFDTVKYFAQEVAEQRRFGTLLQNWFNRLQGYFATFRLFDIVVGNLSLLSLAAIMALAVLDLKAGKLGFSDFLLVSSFSLFLFPRLVGLLFVFRELAKRYDDLRRYLNLLDEPITVQDPADPQEVQNLRGAVEFADVSFAYPEGEVVLDHFSLAIKPGESVALVGYSGAGKTTVTKLLMRFFDPTAGHITIDEVDVAAMKKTYLRTLVGIVPQDPIMFNNSIAFNVRYARPEASDQEVAQALHLARLSDFVASLPEKEKTVVGERGIKLSGGQRQRLAIARLLLERPKIIVFDEATSSLDSASERKIQAAFWAMAKDPANPRTSVIIAHRLSTVMRADRIVVLDKGQTVEVGTHRQLLQKKDGIYRKLWELQQDGLIGE